MEIHVQALFTSEENGRLRGVNDPDGETGPAPPILLRAHQGRLNVPVPT